MNAWQIVLPGMLVAFGLVLCVLAFSPQHHRLADALAVLGDTTPVAQATPAASRGLAGIGGWWLTRRPGVPSTDLHRQLQLRGRSYERHLGIKIVAAGVGVAVPFVAGVVSWVLTGQVPLIPGLVALVAGLMAYVLPDVLLRSTSRATNADATEALLVYFDLVTLERMANQSATQALTSAAALSDVAIFATIRAALERAKLQQRMPFAELREVGRELDLPALVDLADVMRLDEAGASLSGSLRARVKELRDAHLTDAKVAAAEMSERMTGLMVMPSLVFGLIFLIPPLLTLVGG